MPHAQAILVAVAAAVVYGILGVCFQLAGERRLNILAFLFWKQLIGTVFAGAACVIVGAPPVHGSLVFAASVAAITYVTTAGAYVRATQERDIGASWTVLNLSVILPISISVLWFGDPFTGWKAFGAILTLGSVILIGGGSQAGGWRHANLQWTKWIALAFLCNGWLAVLLRFVRPHEGWTFTLLFYGFSVLLVLSLLMVRREQPMPSRALLLVAAGGAASHIGGMALTILALSLMTRVSSSPGVVVYPITNGLVIPIGVVLGLVFLRQKSQPRTLMGVVLGMAALTIFFL